MTAAYLGFASLVVILVLLALWFRAMRQLAIPRNRSIHVATAVLAAGLGVVALLGEPGWLGGVAAGLGTFASVLFLFTVAIGRQVVADDAIQVGATIPHFTATDEHGRTFDSESLAGHPVVIKFFRAHW